MPRPPLRRRRGAGSAGRLVVVAACSATTQRPHGGGVRRSTPRADIDRATRARDDRPSLTAPTRPRRPPTDRRADRRTPPNPARRRSTGSSSASQLEQATLDVPIDYDDPDGDTFTLFLVRRLADDQANKIGSLLINPGGPGAGGAEFAAGAEFVFDERAARALRHRRLGPAGHGLHRAGDRLHRRLRRVLRRVRHHARRRRRAPADRRPRRGLPGRSASTKNADILQHVGTNDSARDIDSIRRALGEDTISYFGFSYGSELGATWATLFPDTVRAAVLDGAADPTVGLRRGRPPAGAGASRARSATYLAQCSADPDCDVPQRRRRRGRVRRADGWRSTRSRSPSEPGRPDVDPRRRPAGRRPRRCTTTPAGPSCPRRWPTPRTATARALLTLWDSYYDRNAGRHVAELPRGLPDHQLHGRDRAPDRRRGRRHAPRVHEPSPRGSRRARPARTSARSTRRPSHRGSTSPAPVPGRSSSSAPPATRRRRWPARG